MKGKLMMRSLCGWKYRLHNNIVPPSTLGQKADYYLFKVSLAELPFLPGCASDMAADRDEFLSVTIS